MTDAERYAHIRALLTEEERAHLKEVFEMADAWSADNTQTDAEEDANWDHIGVLMDILDIDPNKEITT